MTVFALALLACSNQPAVLSPPSEVERADTFLLELGGVPIAIEERQVGVLAGEPVVWRKRTYAWQMGGEAVQAQAVTRAIQAPSGQTIAYARQLNVQPIESWTGLAWLPEIAAAQGNLPTGRVEILVPELLDVQSVAITRDGDVWSWPSSGATVQLTRTANGPVATWGGLSLRPVTQADPLEPVDPVALLRRKSEAFPTARKSHRATFSVNGDTMDVRTPLLAELPVNEPMVVPTDHVSWQGLQRVQAEEIVAQAKELTGTTLSRREAVKRLVMGVQASLKVAPTPGSPDALQALQRGTGDCNEHAQLMASLAIASGIPARTVAGAVYTADGPLGPGLDLHAWTEVWMADQWVPVDPAFGQVIADATHLALARSGRIEQSLAPWMTQEIRLEAVY